MQIFKKPWLATGCFVLAAVMPACDTLAEIPEPDVAQNHDALIPLPEVDLTKTVGAMCSINGGCRVTLEGQKFRGSATVIYVDGVPATRYFSQTSTRQEFEVPAAKPGRIGPVDIVVSNDSRPPAREQTLGKAFFYFADTADFLPQGVLRTPAPPRSLVAADLDGDGQHDLAIISEGRDFVDVFLGRSGGRYAAPLSFRAGEMPVAIAVANLNGEKSPDIAVVSEKSDSLTLLLSNARKPFDPDQVTRVMAVPPPGHRCRRPSDVLLTDLSNDKKVDVAVSCRGGDGQRPQIWGFLGDGLGGLASPYSDADYAGSPLGSLLAILPGPLPTILELGESRIVDWRSSLGGATFGDNAPVKAFGGRLATTLVGGDVNRDGTTDLLVIEEAKKQVVVMETILGTGIVPPRIAPLPLRAAYQQLFVADVNGDGKLDVLATSGATAPLSTVDLFFGNGDGTFGAQQAVDLGILYRRAAVTDVDGDGRPDLVLMGAELPYTTPVAGEGFLFIARNEGGTFRSDLRQPTLPNPEVVTSADFDGDSEPDLAVVSRGVTSQVQIWKGLGSGRFAPVASPLKLMDTLDLITVVPQTGALPNLAVANSTTGSVRVLLNTAGSLREGCTYTYTGQKLVALSAGYVFDGKNPDMSSEIVAVSDSLLNFMWPAASGKCPDAKPKASRFNDVMTAVAVDLGGGKSAELVITRWNAVSKTHELLVQQVDSTGKLNQLDKVPLTAEPTSLMVSDLSGDGKPDIVVLHAGTDQATVLLQKPTKLAFSAIAPQPTCATPEAAWAYDLNADRRSDLVVACVGMDRTVQPFYGDGLGNFAPARRAVPWTPLGPVELLASKGKPWLLLLHELTGVLTPLTDLGF